MNLKIKKEISITSPDLWKLLAPPMDGDKQWKEGRSAWSLAKFATDYIMVDKVLKPVLKDLGYKTSGDITCIPEAVTPLFGRGNGRNHDLLMIGKDFVCGIEAKVTEPFGNIIGKDLTEASDNRLGRIERIINVLFGCKLTEDFLNLRYQLLTGAVGTYLEANKNHKKKALFLVIVFKDTISAEDSTAVARNNEDYENFCKMLGLGKEGGTIKVSSVDLTIKKIEVSFKKQYKD